MLINRLICLIMFSGGTYLLYQVYQELRERYILCEKNKNNIVLFVIEILILVFFVIAFGEYIIKELPKTINGEYSLMTGVVEEYSVIGNQNYNLILQDDGELYELENIFSDSLQKGDYVEIAFYPLEGYYYMDVVQKINGETTDCYRNYYGNLWADRLWVAAYILVNIALQLWLLKKEYNRMSTGIEKWLGNIWRYGVFVYSGVLLISYVDIFDNDVLGIVVCMLFIIHSFAEALYLLCVARRESRNSDTQTSAVYGAETQGEKGKEVMTEEEKKRIAKRNWIKLIVAFTVMAVIITAVNCFVALESRRWMILVFYSAAYVIGMAAIVYAMKHQKKKEEDGKKEND